MPEGRAEVSSGSSRLDLWRHLSETQTSAGLTASDKWEPVKAKQLTLSTLIPNERAPTHTHAEAHTRAGWGPVSHVRRLDGLRQQSHTFSAGGSQGATPQHSIHPYDRSEPERRRERNSALRTDFYTFLFVAEVWKKLSKESSAGPVCHHAALGLVKVQFRTWRATWHGTLRAQNDASLDVSASESTESAMEIESDVLLKAIGTLIRSKGQSFV